jgi:hypothetical protein
MAKNDFGRFRNRGSNNGRYTIGTTQPEDPVINDIWVNPEIITLYSKKSADQGTTTTAYANITDLSAIFPADSLYKVTIRLYVTGPTTDFKTTISSAGLTLVSYLGSCGPGISITSVTDCTVRRQGSTLSAGLAFGCDGSNISYIDQDCLVSTAVGITGSMQVTFGQYTSTTSRTTVTANSYLLAKPITSNIKYYNGSAWAALL